MSDVHSEKLVLFDGNALLHRAYHAFPQTLRTSQGELTNAVYGFTSTLLTVFRKLQPTHTIVAFDEKAPTFRHKQFKGYKASRPKMDEELAGQIKRTKEVVSVLNIPQFGIEGYEADDVLGTLSYQAEQNGFEAITIVTGDRDALQLISAKTSVYFPSRGRIPEKTFDQEIFEKEYGFKPKQLIDYKALVGDSSDEIPGVKGIGPKAATQLITKYGSMETIYQHLSEISGSLKDKLEIDRDIAKLSKELATIIINVPITFDKAKSRLTDYNREEAEELFLQLEFRSLLKRLPGDSWEEMVQDTMGGEAAPKKTKKKTADNQMGLF
ncbi:hypothetical protein GYA49_05955 [Candidatus Beckwithbacteria bacterium]|nr:hypothetical protein [Candidatus Beckwithbacteria bacterium]